MNFGSRKLVLSLLFSATLLLTLAKTSHSSCNTLLENTKFISDPSKTHFGRPIPLSQLPPLPECYRGQGISDVREFDPKRVGLYLPFGAYHLTDPQTGERFTLYHLDQKDSPEVSYLFKIRTFRIKPGAAFDREIGDRVISMDDNRGLRDFSQITFGDSSILFGVDYPYQFGSTFSRFRFDPSTGHLSSLKISDTSAPKGWREFSFESFLPISEDRSSLWPRDPLIVPSKFSNFPGPQRVPLDLGALR